MRQIVETKYREPKEREDFLLKFIGIGAFVAIYDLAWAYTLKSQILLLEELNRRALSLDEAKEFTTTRHSRVRRNTRLIRLTNGWLGYGLRFLSFSKERW